MMSELRERHTGGYNESGDVAARRELTAEKKDRTAFDRVKDDLVSVFFVGFSIFVLLQFDVLGVMLNNQKIHRWLMWVGLAGFGTNALIGLFLVVYVEWWQKQDMKTYHPLAIPIATGAACFGFVVLTIALWPVFHLLTPVILFIAVYGIVNLISLF
eukprot:TRINITY_DN49179_c0_g1_i1.p1 TRINITY_DN49179_c0_g1~~TRINITY_DN49179_c0_g1_i1.p1  ORF type:complete len:157 (-),score=28.43 TRINITY_DN49179_c0_g1_i1:43-513(-)